MARAPLPPWNAELDLHSEHLPKAAPAPRHLLPWDSVKS